MTRRRRSDVVQRGNNKLLYTIRLITPFNYRTAIALVYWVLLSVLGVLVTVLRSILYPL